MPTAETVQWKKETVRSEVWPKTLVCLLSWGEIPPGSVSNEQLEAEIQKARLLLELDEDWDGEGSSGYSLATLNRAIRFVKTYAARLWSARGSEPPIPSIGPGPEGSIDIHWKQPSWELLVNIPADVNQMAAFYGDNYGTQKIKGRVNPEVFNLGIAEWLAN
jgi:hypothetical protein